VRKAGAVKNPVGANIAQRRLHLTALENIDLLPAGEIRNPSRNFSARPGDQLRGAGEVLEKVTAGESTGSGDENDGHGGQGWPNRPKKFENVPSPARTNEKFRRRSFGIGEPVDGRKLTS